MSGYIDAHVKSACAIVESYAHREPFPKFLKEYFRRNKKFGSRDRKVVSELCYCFFRAGRSVESESVPFQLAIGYFLSHSSDNGVIASQFELGLTRLTDRFESKIDFLKSSVPGFSPQRIFPYWTGLGEIRSRPEFLRAHFQKSPVFLRIRPGAEGSVKTTLTSNGISHQWIGQDCVSLEQSFDVSSILELDREAVVQDISSQHVADFFPVIDRQPIRIWDACAGSGGKSILAIDHYSGKKVDLYVSDVRNYILEEAAGRFQRAGISPAHMFPIDLSNALSVQMVKGKLPEGADLLMLDVPCTGSGTWGRNPEWLRSFDEEHIPQFVQLQQSIVRHAAQSIAENGYLLYVTCSVFASENEEQVQYIQNEIGLHLLHSSYITHGEEGGDYLFAALFKK